MSTLTTQLFGRVEDNSEDEEQLLKLFWNRAELKKELDTLRRESFQLTEKLTQQEAVTLRVQARLDQLEVQLADPEGAIKAVAYYHLQGVWNICRGKLQTLASELSRAQHDHQYRQHVAAFRQALNDSLSGIQRTLSEVSASGDALSAEIRMLREQRTSARGIWNFFKRRRLTAAIEEQRRERRSITMRLGELTEEIQARSSQEAPEFEGLDTDSRRAINMQLIAYAQELYLHFLSENAASLAREAAIRGLNDLNLGSRRDCRMLYAHIEKRLAALAADDGIELRVKQRFMYLQTEQHYRRDTDTVPIASTLGYIPTLAGDGARKERIAVNVLGDEYWDIFAVLLT